MFSIKTMKNYLPSEPIINEIILAHITYVRACVVKKV